MKLFSKCILILTVFLIGSTVNSAQIDTRKRTVGTDIETPKFRAIIENRLSGFFMQNQKGEVVKSKLQLKDICPIDTNLAAERVFYDYGAIFVADNSIRFPTKCIFQNEGEVQTYQNASNPVTLNIGGTSITLQKSAMDALVEARKAAAKSRLTITPRGGSISGKRSFNDTYRLWNSRFFPGLNYWTRRKKITRVEAEEAKALDIQEQVAKVLEWEDEGFYFSTGFNKSILYSVAAPGASQHIFMLALDVKQFNSSRVREILADHGWYQTVKSDLPHFTYLGKSEDELPALGLKSVTSGGYKFWIPNQ